MFTYNLMSHVEQKRFKINNTDWFVSIPLSWRKTRSETNLKKAQNNIYTMNVWSVDSLI